MVVITVPRRTPLRRIEGEREGARVSESKREPLVSKSLSSELCYPERCKEAERRGGKAREEAMEQGGKRKREA